MMKDEDIHILYADTPTIGIQKMRFKCVLSWQPLGPSFSTSVHLCASLYVESLYKADVDMLDDDYSYITASN